MATEKIPVATTPKSVYVPLRMPTELHSRVEAHRQALSQAAGGAGVAFSFAVFHLVQAGLDAQQQGNT